MTALTASRNLLEPLWGWGTGPAEHNGAKRSHLIDGTRSSLDSSGVRSIEKVERAGPIAHTQELITSNFSFDDLVSDLKEVFIEATRTAESMALWTGEHLAGLASPVESDEDVLIDLMLQRVPLSVESIRLKVEFVEPRFQWSNEVEIDPFDKLD